MSEDKDDAPGLVAAAEAFDQELSRFGKLADAVLKAPLDSQKSIERAARALKEISESEGRLGSTAQALLAALDASRRRQEGQASALQARAYEIQARAEVANDLMRRYGALGEAAASVGELVKELAQRTRKPEGGFDTEELAGPVATLLDRMSDLAISAQTLSADAKKEQFDDLSRQADALRQQVLSARNKMALMAKPGSNGSAPN
jgi:hypothetical protein